MLILVGLHCSARAPVWSFGTCLAAYDFTHLSTKKEIHILDLALECYVDLWCSLVGFWCIYVDGYFPVNRLTSFMPCKVRFNFFFLNNQSFSKHGGGKMGNFSREIVSETIPFLGEAGEAGCFENTISQYKCNVKWCGFVTCTFSMCLAVVWLGMPCHRLTVM